MLRTLEMFTTMSEFLSYYGNHANVRSEVSQCIFKMLAYYDSTTLLTTLSIIMSNINAEHNSLFVDVFKQGKLLLKYYKKILKLLLKIKL